MTTDGRTDRYYVESPCGHGKLVDVVPDGTYERDGRQAWGVVLVVQRHDSPEPVRCCSAQEGEHATEEDALLACEAQKRYSEGQLLQALAVLDCAANEVWRLARVRLDDLLSLREKLANMVMTTGDACDAPLCFKPGVHMWLVDEERDACLCEAHLKGKKIYGRGDEEIVFESWAKYEEVVA